MQSSSSWILSFEGGFEVFYADSGKPHSVILEPDRPSV